LLPPEASSASLLENKLNKEGIVQPCDAAISKQTNSNSSIGWY
jgi:hypothetical protein